MNASSSHSKYVDACTSIEIQSVIKAIMYSIKI